MGVTSARSPSLVCAENHSFDLSAKGYVNLLLPGQRKSAEPGYSKEMLQARRAMSKLGFFDPVCEAVADLIQRHSRLAAGSGVFDAGCGEGHIFSSVISRLRGSQGSHPDAIGLDISRQGIALACHRDHSIMWCVANLDRRLPFASGGFEILTNILAPSNVMEFRRVLRGSGLLVKVIPLDDHLVELRNALYERPRGHPLTAEATEAELGASFDVVQKRRLTYRRQVGASSLRDLVRMTPLFWKAKRERIEALETAGLPQVTVDLCAIAAIAR